MVLNFAAMACAFATSVLLSRVLGARGYGIYVYALAWPALLAVFAQAGTAQLVVRDVAAYEAREEWGLVRGIVQYTQRVVLRASVALMVGAAIVGWAFVGHDQPMLRRALAISLVLIPVLSLIAQSQAVLRGFRRIVLGRLPETVVQPVLLLAFLGAAYASRDGKLTPTDAMVATVAAAVGALVFGTVSVLRVMPVEVRSAVVRVDRARWARSARLLVAIGGLLIVNLQMSVLLLGALDSVDATAVLSVALRWSGLVAFVQTAATFPLAPVLARLNETGSRADVQRLVSKASAGILVLSSPIIVSLLIFGDQAMGLFGSQFPVGTTALTILVLGETVNVATGMAGVLLVSAGHERTLFTAAAGLTAVRFVLSAVLIELFGLHGAAVGQASGVALQNAVLVVLAWRRIGIYTPGLGGRRLQRRQATVS